MNNSQQNDNSALRKGDPQLSANSETTIVPPSETPIQQFYKPPTPEVMVPLLVNQTTSALRTIKIDQLFFDWLQTNKSTQYRSQEWFQDLCKRRINRKFKISVYLDLTGHSSFGMGWAYLRRSLPDKYMDTKSPANTTGPTVWKIHNPDDLYPNGSLALVRGATKLPQPPEGFLLEFCHTYQNCHSRPLEHQPVLYPLGHGLKRIFVYETDLKTVMRTAKYATITDPEFPSQFTIDYAPDLLDDSNKETVLNLGPAFDFPGLELVLSFSNLSDSESVTYNLGLYIETEGELCPPSWYPIDVTNNAFLARRLLWRNNDVSSGPHPNIDIGLLSSQNTELSAAAAAEAGATLMGTVISGFIQRQNASLPQVGIASAIDGQPAIHNGVHSFSEAFVDQSELMFPTRLNGFAGASLLKNSTVASDYTTKFSHNFDFEFPPTNSWQTSTGYAHSTDTDSLVKIFMLKDLKAITYSKTVRYHITSSLMPENCRFTLNIACIRPVPISVCTVDDGNGKTCVKRKFVNPPIYPNVVQLIPNGADVMSITSAELQKAIAENGSFVIDLPVHNTLPLGYGWHDAEHLLFNIQNTVPTHHIFQLAPVGSARDNVALTLHILPEIFIHHIKRAGPAPRSMFPVGGAQPQHAARSGVAIDGTIAMFPPSGSTIFPAPVAITAGDQPIPDQGVTTVTRAFGEDLFLSDDTELSSYSIPRGDSIQLFGETPGSDLLPPPTDAQALESNPYPFPFDEITAREILCSQYIDFASSNTLNTKYFNLHVNGAPRTSEAVEQGNNLVMPAKACNVFQKQFLSLFAFGAGIVKNTVLVNTSPQNITGFIGSTVNIDRNPNLNLRSSGVTLNSYDARGNGTVTAGAYASGNPIHVDQGGLFQFDYTQTGLNPFFPISNGSTCNGRLAIGGIMPVMGPFRDIWGCYSSTIAGETIFTVNQITVQVFKCFDKGCVFGGFLGFTPSL